MSDICRKFAAVCPVGSTIAHHLQHMNDTQQLVNTIIDGIQEKKGREVVTVNLELVG